MSDPAPTSAPSKKSSFGISWMGWNCPPGITLLGQHFFFLLLLFFPARLFSLAQFFLGNSFFITFFWLTLDPKYFSGKLLPTPTHLPPCFLPTHLPPSSCWPPPHTPPLALTSITRASDLKRAWVTQSFKSTKSTGASRVGSFKSAPTRGASTRWQ